MKIKQKLITIFIVMFTAQMLAIVGFSFINTKNALEEASKKNLRLIVEGHGAQIFKYITQKKGRTAEFTERFFLQDKIKQINSLTGTKEKARVSKTLSDLLKAEKNFLDTDLDEIFIYDLKGMAIASTETYEFSTHIDIDELLLTNKIKGTYVQDIRVHTHNNERVPYIGISTPIKDRNTGKVIGVLMNLYHLDHIQDILAGKRGKNLGALPGGEKEYQDVNAFISNKDGLKVCRIHGGIKIDIKTEPVMKCINENKGITAKYVNHENKMVWGASECLNIEKDWIWALVVEQDENILLASIYKFRNISFILFLTALCVSGIVVYFVARSIARPIRKLHEGVEIIGSGNLGHKVGTGVKDEIGHLSSAFDQMTENLKSITASRDELNSEIEVRKKAEERILKQNKFLENVLESLTYPFYVINANDYTIEIANTATFKGNPKESTKCYSLTHRLSKPCGDKTHPCPLDEMKRTKKPVIMEHVHYDKNDNEIYVEVHGYPIFDSNGDVFQMIEYCIDITNRYKSEKALRESEAELRTILDSVNAGIVIIDAKTHEIVDANTLALKLIGDSKDRVIGSVCHGYICPAEAGKCPITDLKQTIDLSERKLLNVNVDSIPILKSVVPVQLKDRLVLVESFVDITALKKTEDLIKNILEGVDEGFIIIDRDYRIVLANRGFAEEVKIPVEDIIGNYCYKISHRCDKPCYEVGEDCAPMRTFMTGMPYTAIHTHYTKDGDPFFIETKSYPIKDASGEVLSVIETCNNITEKRRLEDQLRHAQKMEAVGTFAGGIAHDFNNILNVIIGYSTMVIETLEAGSSSKEQLKEVLVAADRAETLTKRLLLFSRKEAVEIKPTNLNDIVIKMEKMLSRIIGEDIKLITDLMDTKATVLADAGQIEQVLMNLATNARDAMPQGGNLTVRTELRGIDTEFIKNYDYGEPGTYAVISITDTGTGIDKEKQAWIFDPFFTTKEVGKGTGLGLSMSYGIIKQHKGYINLYSEIGKGTTFNIWLPVIKDIVEKKPEVERLSSMKGGTETILVAEDDAPLRKLTRTVLEKAGYHVITAEDGDDAITKFTKNKENIQLLILDMIMPKKNGKEAYQEIVKLSPGVKTLFTSGYTMDIIRTREIIAFGVDFIHKPVMPKDLLKKVRKILDR